MDDLCSEVHLVIEKPEKQNCTNAFCLPSNSLNAVIPQFKKNFQFLSEDF